MFKTSDMRFEKMTTDTARRRSAITDLSAAGIQEMDESLIKLGGVLDGISAASGWPGTDKK